MGRLTKTNILGACAGFYNIVDKLAEYENTKLTPQEIVALKAENERIKQTSTDYIKDYAHEYDVLRKINKSKDERIRALTNVNVELESQSELLWEIMLVFERALILSIHDTKICQDFEDAQLGASIRVESHNAAVDYYLKQATSSKSEVENGLKSREDIKQEIKRKDEIIVKDNRHINNLDKENEANKQRIAVLEQEVVNLKKQVEGSHKNQTELVNGATHHLAEKERRIEVLERALESAIRKQADCADLETCPSEIKCGSEDCKKFKKASFIRQAESEISEEK